MLIGYRAGEFGDRCKARAENRRRQEEAAAAHRWFSAANQAAAQNAYQSGLNAERSRIMEWK